MDHPNAFAAAAAAGASIGAQWLVNRYAHLELSEYWKNAVTAGTTVVTLYIGRAGLKAALARLWNGPKAIWAGSPTPPLSPPAE